MHSSICTQTQQTFPTFYSATSMATSEPNLVKKYEEWECWIDRHTFDVVYIRIDVWSDSSCIMLSSSWKKCACAACDLSQCRRRHIWRHYRFHVYSWTKPNNASMYRYLRSNVRVILGLITCNENKRGTFGTQRQNQEIFIDYESWFCFLRSIEFMYDRSHKFSSGICASIYVLRLVILKPLSSTSRCWPRLPWSSSCEHQSHYC